MRRDLRGSMVLDAGVLIEILFSTLDGLKVREKLIEGLIYGYTAELAITGPRYVTCRKLERKNPIEEWRNSFFQDIYRLKVSPR